MTVDGQILFKIPECHQNIRADKILAEHFPEFSRSQIQEVFKGGFVLLKGESIEQKHKVSTNDVLSLELPRPKPTTVVPVEMPLEFLYEDKDIVVVNKGSGIVVHPGNATGEDTLAHALLHHTKGQLCLFGGEERPGVVHRLDKETTGAIVFAKSNEAYLGLVKMFAEREIRKEYLALVQGVPELDSGTIKSPIGRNPIVRVKMAIQSNGRAAHTDWAIEKRFIDCTLLRCWLYTGRTHQIRVHLSHIGHPLLGDRTYGYRPSRQQPIPIERVMLHAQLLEFPHPVTHEKITFKAPVPDDFQHQIEVRC